MYTRAGFTGVAQLLSAQWINMRHLYIHRDSIIYFKYSVRHFRLDESGRSFTLYSIISVALTTIFLGILPETSVSHDILLNAVFGVISAVGIGITLKYGASTGGLDIVAMVLAKWKDKPVGTYFFILNGIIIFTAGLLQGWEKALYTLVTLYVTTRVIDAIHTRHEKLTAMIVTKKADEIKEAIYGKMVRGITTVPAKELLPTSQKK
ncbi:YitT family protein [Bacillus sp. SL00103]